MPTAQHRPAVTRYCYLGTVWHRLCDIAACECRCHKAKT